MVSRRSFLHATLGAAAAVPFSGWLRPRRAKADDGRARRLIVFYFPDGIAGRSQDGESSLWEARSAAGEVVLSEQLSPLEGVAADCLFVNGLSMGSTDEGSHPGGARKLLTGVDGGNGQSIDQYLAATVGRDTPHRHVYLGVMANVAGATGDKHISYPSAGFTTPPEDDPLVAFRRLFGEAGSPAVSPPSPGVPELDPRRSILDTALADLTDLRAALGMTERSKLDQHVEALREVEMRLAGVAGSMGSTGASATCDMPDAPASIEASRLYDPAVFPALLRAQTDVLVQALACGLSRVGVLQASHHTSELVMSRFEGTEMHDPGFDMRSHQASHYGARQDRSNPLFVAFLQQRRWWMEQFAYLVEQLRSRPEGDGTMLDHSVVLLCSEVSDGNTHSHHDMPFVLAGRAGGRIETGRVLDAHGRRHGDLLAAIAHAMGEPVAGWGQASTEPLPGVLS